MSAVKTLYFTLVRHGESADNVRALWAGWKDSPLTNHGMNQARALGEALSKTPFFTIYTSSLQRAADTAQAIQSAQKNTEPSIVTSLLLREQHFGDAEGKSFSRTYDPGLTLEGHYTQGKYPSPRNRALAFPGGESSNDLAERAREAISVVVQPFLEEAVEQVEENAHVAVVSHGLFLGEFIKELVKRFGGIPDMRKHRGMKNTGWTRVKLERVARSDGFTPKFHVQVTHINQHDHLQTVMKQGGGIGNSRYDPKQRDIRVFFGGGAGSASKNK